MVKPALSIDQTEHLIIMTVNRLYNHLSDYIPRANEREVMDFLYKFYTEGDLILIPKDQLKIYKEMEKHFINISLLTPNGGILNNE